jgi:hypothetical protein
MRPSRFPFLRAILVVCVLLPTAAAGAGTLGSASPAKTAANSVTFQDSTGEDPQAPDITTVVVSNDDAGRITFRINVPNRRELGPDMLVDILVDTDNNPATGDPTSFGADYAIELLLGEVALFRWDGANFTRRPGDPASTSLLFSYSSGAAITISAAELGNTKQLGFNTSVISGIVIDPATNDLDFTNAKADFAPQLEAGLYKFQVKLVPASLQVRKLTRSPARPVAGKPFSLRMTVARSDTSAVLRSGRVTCIGRIGRSPLRATAARVANGVVVCTWAIPAAAKGKTFRGSAAVVFEGLRAGRSFSSKIG